MSQVVLDDHLLRDVLAGEEGRRLARLVATNELATTNHESALQFYSALFGWNKSREFDMGPQGKYLIYGAGGVDLGGMFTKGKDTPKPPSWLYYVEVMGLDAAVGRAKAKGAKILNGPMEVPGGARIAQLADPQGVPFALHEAKK